jgi:hypothetical protein
MQFAKMTPSEGQTYSKMISLVDGMVSILGKIVSDGRRFSTRIQEMDKERKHLRIDTPYSWMTQLHQTRSVFRNEDVINKNPAARVSRGSWALLFSFLWEFSLPHGMDSLFLRFVPTGCTEFQKIRSRIKTQSPTTKLSNRTNQTHKSINATICPSRW